MRSFRPLLPCLLLAACATRPTPVALPPEAVPSTPAIVAPEPPPAAPAVPKPSSLVAEQRRFAELFRGTPVSFTMQPDGSMKVSVPLQYAFDAGRHAIKPPLAAVLDRVARSQRREATRLHVAAPADPSGKGTSLAAERARSTRDYLVGRGVDARRFSIDGSGSGASVVILVAGPK